MHMFSLLSFDPKCRNTYLVIYRHLHTVVSEVNQLTARVITTTSQVCDCDMTALEEMHQTAEQWAKEVSYLESYIDSIVLKWKNVSDKVVDAAKMANVPLLSKQVKISV